MGVGTTVLPPYLDPSPPHQSPSFFSFSLPPPSPSGRPEPLASPPDLLFAPLLHSPSRPASAFRLLDLLCVLPVPTRRRLLASRARKMTWMTPPL
eukprot:1598131-Rhodomonas_salina.4